MTLILRPPVLRSEIVRIVNNQPTSEPRVLSHRQAIKQPSYRWTELTINFTRFGRGCVVKIDIYGPRNQRLRAQNHYIVERREADHWIG